MEGRRRCASSPRISPHLPHLAKSPPFHFTFANIHSMHGDGRLPQLLAPTSPQELTWVLKYASMRLERWTPLLLSQLFEELRRQQSLLFSRRTDAAMQTAGELHASLHTCLMAPRDMAPFTPASWRHVACPLLLTSLGATWHALSCSPPLAPCGMPPPAHLPWRHVAGELVYMPYSTASRSAASRHPPARRPLFEDPNLVSSLDLPPSPPPKTPASPRFAFGAGAGSPARGGGGGLVGRGDWSGGVAAVGSLSDGGGLSAVGLPPPLCPHLLLKRRSLSVQVRTLPYISRDLPRSPTSLPLATPLFSAHTCP